MPTITQWRKAFRQVAEDERRGHPSGRPVRKEPRITGRPRWNIPDDGYVTPRLKEGKRPDAIGFVANHLPGHQSDED